MLRFLCCVSFFLNANTMEHLNLEKIDSNGSTPLLAACGANNFEQIKKMVALGAQVNFQKNNGITPLLLAVHHINLPAVELLLNYGANPNIATTCGSGYNGKTPLLLALSLADSGNNNDIKNIIVKLVEAGADPRTKDCKNYDAQLQILNNYKIRPASEKRFEALSHLTKEKIP